ncbi:MAG: hypothetical protein ABI068_16615 [Ktedonobacterales bacterium]
MVAQFCPFCGKPITAPDAKFCAFCGQAYPWSHDVSNPASSPTTTPSVALPAPLAAGASPYSSTPSTPVYAGAQPTLQPQSPQPAAGYAPVYATPAPAMAPYGMQAKPAPMSKPVAANPGRLVGVTIGFGVLALILGFLTQRLPDRFILEIPFSGWEVAGLLFWLGLMRSLTKSAGRVLGEMLAVALGYVLFATLLLLAWEALRYHEFTPPYFLLYGLGPISLILLFTALFCWGFVSLAGTWPKAHRAGVHPLPAIIYPLVIGVALIPLLLRFLVYYLVGYGKINALLSFYLDGHLVLIYYFFVLLGVAELVAFTALGSAMAWQRVKRAQIAAASAAPVATPVATR